jgi:hypothetical protein
MNKEEKTDELFLDNNTRALYFRIADNLPAFIKELEISAKRGSQMAAKELKTYKAMMELFKQSELGKYF